MMVRRSIRSAAGVAAVCGMLTGAVLMAGAETFGKGVSLNDATPLASVIATPSTYEGKTVRVEGVVTSVCEEMGCWLALAPTAAAGDKSLIIQVEHGVVVFPMSAKGRRAAAEGIVQRVGSAESRAAADELARQEGKPAADGGQWQIKATGALLF
jgi:hypothetical protein